MKPLTPSKQEQVKALLRESIIAFGKAVSPKTFYLESPPVHFEMERLMLDESIRQLNIIAPRGIAKTALATMMILHHLFNGDGGKKVVVVISKTQAHAKSILSTIKNILDFSANFRRIYGYHGEQVAKVWREDRIVLDNGDSVIARGTGQPIRGINEDLQRPTLEIVDDPEDENNTKTIDAMETNVRWILQTVVPSKDTHRGRVIVIGTPLHEKCIVETLKGLSDWTTVHFGNDRELGVALWEESLSLEALNAKFNSYKDAGLVRIYYQEYECKLIPGEDALFKKEYVQYYNSETQLKWDKDESYLHFPSGVIVPVSVYMGIDPASSVNQSADYSTIVPVAVTASMDIYVLDYFHKRVTPLALVEAIEDWYHRFRPRLSLIESTGYQEMLRQYLRTRIFIPGLEHKERPRDSKSNRLEMLQPFFAQKKVFIKESQTDLYDELILFPKAKHDDLLDGLYYAVKRIKPPSHSIEIPKEPLPEYQQVIVEYYGQQEESELPSYFDVFA